MATTSDATVFRANLRGSWKTIEHKATVILNGLTFVLYADIVERTRFDTGRARAGWQISVYTAGPGFPAPGQYKQYQSGRSGLEFVAEIATAPLEAKRIIYNNVHYIVWLELGTETRPGDHMVKLAIAKLASGG